MLVFSTYVPYLPIVIGKGDEEREEKLKNTLKAIKEVERELYASKPDVVIVIGKHGDMLPEAYTASMSIDFKTSFHELGDFETTMSLKGDIGSLQRIKEDVMSQFPFVLFSEEQLPYTISSPLQNLMGNLKNTPIIPIYYSLRDNADHYEFGKKLRDVIEGLGKRVAVVAAGNLSHCVTKEGPGRFKNEGKDFDEAVLAALNKQTDKKIIKLDEKMTKKAQECGLRSLLIILGLISDHNYNTEILEYEYPFGVGYLTVNFKMY